MARRRKPDDSTLPLDFESRERERYAMLRCLHLGRSATASHVRFLLEIIAGVAGDGELTWTYARLAERMCLPERTLKRVVAAAESAGLLLVRRSRRPDGTAGTNAIAVNWARIAARSYDEPGRSRPSRPQPSEDRERPSSLTGAPAGSASAPAETTDARAPGRSRPLSDSTSAASENEDPPPATYEGRDSTGGQYGPWSESPGANMAPPEGPIWPHQTGQYGPAIGALRSSKGASPPSPPPLTSANKGPGEEWEKVMERLDALGMADARSAIERAKGNGASPELVHRLIDHFEATPGAWGLGALHLRIRLAAPDQPVDALWPPPMVAAEPSPDEESPPLSNEWLEVARALQRMGMGRALACCRIVSAAGLVPADVRRAIAVYQDRGSHNGIGALYERLINALPGDDFEHAWPSPLRRRRSSRVPPTDRCEPESPPPDPELAALIESCSSSREALRLLESKKPRS